MKKRFRFLLSLLLAGALLFGLQAASAATRYKDETDTGCWRWAGKAIHWATDRHVAEGMETGRFEPGKNITRAQAYAMLVRLYEQYEAIPPVGQSAEVFDDCKNAWYTAPIRKAVSGGLLEYRQGGLLRPNEQITRREAVAILFQLPKLKKIVEAHSAWNDNPGFETSFADVLPSSKNVLEIELARRLYIVQGCGENRFQPDRRVTRAEFVRMLYRAAQVQEQDPFKPEKFASILSQASAVVYQDSSSLTPPFSEGPCASLTASEIQGILQAFSGKEWAEVQETPDNLPCYWLHVLDDENLPVLSLGVDELSDGSLYLFQWQNGACHEHGFIVDHVQLPLQRLRPATE